jgi:hypothetical protein
MSGPAIPSRVVVGFAWRPAAAGGAARSARLARGALERAFPPLARTPVVFDLLAFVEDGDAAAGVIEMLALPGARLRLVVRGDLGGWDDGERPPSESIADLESEGGQARFVGGLPKSAGAGDRADAERYVVERCDVLVGLCDLAGPGDADAVRRALEYARELGRPRIWMRSGEPAGVTTEGLDEVDRRTVERIDRYNGERLATTRVERKLNDMWRGLDEAALDARMPIDTVRPVWAYLLPHYARADCLAGRYQQRYRAARALLAVAVAAGGVAAAALLPGSGAVLAAIAGLGVVGAVATRAWRAKWVDYRLLAERLRMALFVASSDIATAAVRPSRRGRGPRSARDWVLSAFVSVWTRRPRPHAADAPRFHATRQFLIKAWISDQLRFHRDRRDQRAGRPTARELEEIWRRMEEAQSGGDFDLVMRDAELAIAREMEEWGLKMGTARG